MNSFSELTSCPTVLQPRDHALWHPVGRGPDIGDDAGDPELRIPYQGDRIVEPPQRRDHGAQLALLLAAPRTFDLAGGIELQMENMVRHAVDLAAHLFESIRLAPDHRLEQADQYVRASWLRGFRGLPDEILEDQAGREADGDQTLRCQHDPQRGAVPAFGWPVDQRH